MASTSPRHSTLGLHQEQRRERGREGVEEGEGRKEGEKKCATSALL